MGDDQRESKPGLANFLQAFVAVVAGNTIYYLLMPYLPPRAQHTLYELDWGVAVDFWFCLVFFGLIKTIVNWRASRGVED